MNCNLPKAEKQKVNGSAEMSLYELNQQLIDQLGEANDEVIAEFKEKVFTYLTAKRNTYYMMLCKEKSYYTIFKVDSMTEEYFEKVWAEFQDIIASVGALYNYYMDPVAPEGIELWIKGDNDVQPICYLFFAYDAGIVEVK